MKSVCFLISSLESGGTENYLLRFLRFLDRDIEVTVICKSGKSGSLEDEFKKCGAKIITRKLGYFSIKNLLTYKNILKRDFDSVCDLTGNFAGLIMLLSKWNGIPSRVTFYRASSHRFQPSFLKNIYSNMMRGFVKLYSTAILSNSSAAFHFFFPEIHLRDERFQIVKNGVDVELFSKNYDKAFLRKKYDLPEEAYLIGHVGRWNPAKNHMTIFKVAKSLLNMANISKRTYFVFCGRETDSKLFSQKLEEFNIYNSCYCLGEQEDVNEVLKCFDLFYFPSITEGQPNALIEAMVSGLPFVASNIDAIKEAVPEEALQQLVDPLNIQSSVNKIKEAMSRESSFSHAEWAKLEYHCKERFDEFKNVLFIPLKNESCISN